MRLQVFSKMAAVVEPLLTNGANGTNGVRRCFILLVSIFSDVMLLEVIPSVKASVANSTRKAFGLTLNVLAQISHTRVSPCS